MGQGLFAFPCPHRVRTVPARRGWKGPSSGAGSNPPLHFGFLAREYRVVTTELGYAHCLHWLREPTITE